MYGFEKQHFKLILINNFLTYSKNQTPTKMNPNLLKYNLIILSIFCFLQSFAQDEKDKTKTEDLIQNILENTEADVDFTQYFEQLENYKNKPLNLNKATESNLQSLLFLSETQIQAFLNYRKNFGKFLSIYELQAIPFWDLELIENLVNFVSIDETAYQEKITFKNIFQKGEHEIMWRSRAVVQQAEGYTETRKNSGNQYYLGDRMNHFLRYRYKMGNRIGFGFTAEKDAGEQFFKGNQQQGFDFYSAHLALHDLGKFKTIVLGDYQLQFGQGLVMWSGLAFGKSPFVMNIKRQARGLRAYRSVNEALFLRGIASSAKIKNFEITTFYSRKNLDARLNQNDSLNQDFETNVSSFLESGFHRTESELESRKKLRQDIIGTNINYKKNGLKIGLTALNTHFQNSIQPNDLLYNTFNFEGNNLFNVGIDYAYNYKNINFFGETAKAFPGGWASTNGALIALDPKLSLSVLQRFFARNYTAFWSNAISEASTNINEQGVYMGLEFKPDKKWQIAGFVDFFRYDWLRFQSDAPAKGTDYFAEIRFRPSKKQNFYLRFRNRAKEQNASNNETPIDFLTNRLRNNLRFNASYKINSDWRFQSRIEFSSFDDGYKNGKETGFLIFQDLGYKSLNSPVSFNFRFALFDTKSFNSRIYAYENDVLYFFSVPAYFGRGSRFYVNMKYRIIKNLDLWLRFAQTTYSDRNTISSGLEEIQGNVKSDFRIQMRYKF